MHVVRSVRWNLALAGLFGLGLALLCLSMHMSGAWAASSIASAAQTRNLGGLLRRTDPSRLHASAADDLAELIPQGLKIPGEGGLGEELRRAVNTGLRQVSVEDPDMADMLANLLVGRGFVSSAVLAKFPPSMLARRAASYSSTAGPTSDTFLLKASFAETGEEVVVTLERKGLFTWRAVRVQVNSGATLWPIRPQR